MQNFNITYEDANKRTLTDSLDLGRFMDMYAGFAGAGVNNNTKLIIPHTAYIDGSFYIQGVIAPKSSIKILAYPEKIINPANYYKTSEGDLMEQFDDTPVSAMLKDFYKRLKELREANEKICKC